WQARRATLSGAPLKNSGFLSIRMCTVALLVAFDHALSGQEFAFSGIERQLWLRYPGPWRGNAVFHKADVIKTSKYSRFRANKKTHALRIVTAYAREVAANRGTKENKKIGLR